MSAVAPDPAATPPSSARLVNVPNALTVLRLAVVPVFAVLLLSDGGMDDDRRVWATVFFALAIIVREVGVTLLRFWVIRHGVIAASRGGKAKTVVQALAIGLYILPLTGLLASARWWVMAVALLLTLATGLDYVYRALTLRRTSARAMRAAAARRAAGPAGSRSDTVA